MCGIIAIVAKDSRGLYAYDRDFFEEALVADSIRGSDSTGVFGISMRNEVHIVKQATDPWTLMKMPTYKDWASKVPQCRAVVGHNRKATSGEIISKNAHPFIEGNIVLVHNGMLFNAKNIHAEADVDSHALCHSFATSGAKETLQNVYGAFALIWYDTKLQEMYLWRNSDRPLAMIETNDKLYIASEFGMLEWLIHREKRYNSIVRKGILTENTLFTIKLQPFKFTSEPLAKKTTYQSWPPSPLPDTGYIPSSMAGEVEDEAPFTPPNPSSAPGWLTELEDKVKDIKAVNDNSIESSNSLRAKYPFESRVLFNFRDVKPWRDSPKGWEITGDIFLPGSPVVKGYIYTNPATTLSQVKLWRDNRKIVGTVSKMMQLPSGSFVIHLDNKKIAVPETILTFNRQILPRLEWDLICNMEKCVKCAKPLDNKEPNGSSVNEKQGKLGVYRVVCHNCIKEAIPKEKRAALLIGPVDLEAVRAVVQTTDILKGSTHGS